MYLIHIKDILQNKEYIYNTNANNTKSNNTKTNSQNDFQNCINYLKTKLPEDDQKKIKHNIFENYCEIYYDSEFKNKGWIWSSTEMRKDVIYFLTKIEIINNKENNSINISTQTESDTYNERSNYNHTDKYNASINTPLIKKTHIKYLNRNKSILNKIYNNTSFLEPLPLINTEYSNKQKSIFDQIYNTNFLTEDNTPNLNPNLNPTLNTSGYAKNPFSPIWPDNLITELQEKLSIHNYGLNPTNSYDL